MAPAATRSTIVRLINASQHSACPCHGCRSATHNHAHHGALALNQLRKFATPVQTVEKEYAFEVRPVKEALQPLTVLVQVAASNLRFGEGVTREVGMDLKNMKARKVRWLPTSSDYDHHYCQ
jgi:hydroxyacid-oxoacid transhydrogenase